MGHPESAPASPLKPKSRLEWGTLNGAPDALLLRVAVGFQACGDHGQSGGGPVGDLCIDVGGEGGVGIGDGIDVDVPAIEDDERRIAFEVGEGCVNRDGAAFAGREGDVVIRIENGEDAVAGGFAAKLEVGHEGDGFAGIGQSDFEAEAGIGAGG